MTWLLVKMIVKSCQNMWKAGNWANFDNIFFSLSVRNWFFANNNFEHDVSLKRFVWVRKDQFVNLSLCTIKHHDFVIFRRVVQWSRTFESKDELRIFWQSRTCVSMWLVNGIGHIGKERRPKWVYFTHHYRKQTKHYTIFYFSFRCYCERVCKKFTCRMYRLMFISCAVEC